MIPFLTGFLGNLPAIQTKQVLRILGQMRDRGEIRTPEDFQQKLTTLAKLVQSGELKQQTPSFAFIEGELLESDAIRTFIDMSRLDTEALLGAAEQIGNAVRAHYKIFAKNYFDAIEAAITELEAETTAYEVLEAHKYSGFTSVIKTCNFSGAIAVPGADKTDRFVSALFTDIRSGRIPKHSPPGRGEPGLRLAIDPNGAQNNVLFDSIEILTGSDTPQTEFTISSEDDLPINAIDGSSDTAWKYSVLLSEHPDVCRTRLGLSFPSAKRVNTLVLHGLADVSMTLIDAAYIDSGGQQISIDIGSSSSKTRSGLVGTYIQSSADWKIDNKETMFSLGDIVARKIIVTLQQSTGVDGEFFYASEIGSWRTNASAEKLNEYLESTSENITTTLGISGEDGGVLRARFAEYVFGLKDTYAIEREYYQDGLFVLEPIVLNKPPKTLALYTDIDWPSDTLANIEFSIRKENYGGSNELLDTETFPFLPYGSESINERVFLIRKTGTGTVNDTGVLRFYPDFSEDFDVYSDGIEVTLGIGYLISIDNGVTWESTLPATGSTETPMTCLLNIPSVRTDNIVVVSYTPLVSSGDSGGEIWINAEKSVRLDRYNIYAFDSFRPSGAVSKCKMGLQIILRANTLNTRVTPYLKELVILGG